MNIDLSELTDYTNKFKRCFSAQQQTEILTQVGRRVGATAVRYAAEYPEPSRKPLPKIYQRVGKDGKAFLSKFKTLKQQIKVIMLGKEGKIPYRRSGTLGKSMTSDIAQVSSTSVTTEVGTNMPGAQYVIGDEGNQSRYHSGTWLTLSGRMTANAGKIKDVAALTYKTEVDKRLS